MKLELLQIDYENHRPNALRFMATVSDQLNDLLSKNDVTLGTQMESRVKTIQSIEEKLTRKSKAISTVTELDDLIGIRIIVLFKSDIQKTCDLIRAHFQVVDEENVSERLEDDQFGYQSTHYTVKFPKERLTLPTLTGLEPYKAEIQIRTLSQHIWAVASHKLQYKQEDNVPSPLRRSINRVSALLETVDLEFERVLYERKQYISHIDEQSEFNVDVLEALCDRLLPAKNKNIGNENYSEMFSELLLNGISSTKEFVEMINENLASQIEEDQNRVESEIDHPGREDIDRLERGVYFTHVGLVRGCLHELKGEDHKYIAFQES